MKLPFSLIKNQSGYMTYFLIIGIIFLGLLFTKLNTTPLINKEAKAVPQFCRDLVDDPEAPVIKGPDYSVSGVNAGVQKDYKLIKQKVPVPYYFLVATPKQHFFNDFEQTVIDKEGKKYRMKVPNGEGGSSYKLKGEDGQENYLVFADYGLLFLFYLNDDGTPLKLDSMEIDPGNFMEVMVADIYKATDKPDLPDWVLKCVDTPAGGISTFKKNGMFTPNQQPSTTKNELQLEYFLLRDYTLMLQAWWTPHCKPAVYLYPDKPTMVNVKVKPSSGFLTYVDPLYDTKQGWNVLANPDGTLINSSFDKDNQKIYDYLYFESKVKDSLVSKPEKGWVIAYNDLEVFYQKTLPQLGFNQKQQSDFIEYWKKSLPQSPFYFVSLAEPKEIDTYETLEITPKPDAVNRVRFYFEARNEFSTVPPLDLSLYYKNVDQNAKFSVFEWGGLLKRDKEHDFTCSM